MSIPTDQLPLSPYSCPCGHDNTDAVRARGPVPARVSVREALRLMTCEKCGAFLSSLLYGSEPPVNRPHPNPGTERSVPPWTPNQVASLNAYQRCGYRHPFTCQCGAEFVANRNGWECPNCTNVQGWAHAYMTDWRWNLAFGREETQASVGAWADATFGPGTVKSRSLRLLDEVVELCLAAGATGMEVDARAAVNINKYLNEHSFASRMSSCPDPDAIPGELADCQIVLDTIGHTANVILDAGRDEKMRVNRVRTWRLTDEGCGQHVDEG